MENKFKELEEMLFNRIKLYENEIIDAVKSNQDIKKITKVGLTELQNLSRIAMNDLININDISNKKKNKVSKNKDKK